MRALTILPLASLIGLGVYASVGDAAPRETTLGRYTTPLDGRTASQRANARKALAALDGAVVRPGEVFSFNDRVGTWSRDAGYRKAPVSFNGQLVTAWGGGVCQTSTTLYNAALLSGMGIVERHPHLHAAQYAPPGRDAAVAFHGIDLRFRNPYPWPVRIVAKMDGTKLSVAILGREVPGPKPQVVTELRELFVPETRELGVARGSGRSRNSGKPGFEVATYRIMGHRKELLSIDSYPVMARVVEFSD